LPSYRNKTDPTDPASARQVNDWIFQSGFKAGEDSLASWLAGTPVDDM